MLTLSMGKRCFDMVKSGEQTEVYKEISDYYETRFWGVFGFKWMSKLTGKNSTLWTEKDPPQGRIRFRNGCGKDKPAFIANCTLRKGTGREEWGAKQGEQYYILDIHGIYDCDNCENRFAYAGDMTSCKCMNKKGECKVLRSEKGE